MACCIWLKRLYGIDFETKNRHMERSHGGRKGGIKDNANNRLLIATRLIVAILLVGMVIIIIPTFQSG
ncbi:hypothetical protein CBFG_03629 [Clostridiales bacterium 1_7_47FAA]|nr:hypothetical protein CBFG_03629 [Clostridiales bacterium 1_7_47FAA]